MTDSTIVTDIILKECYTILNDSMPDNVEGRNIILKAFKEGVKNEYRHITRKVAKELTK